MSADFDAIIYSFLGSQFKSLKVSLMDFLLELLPFGLPPVCSELLSGMIPAEMFPWHRCKGFSRMLLVAKVCPVPLLQYLYFHHRITVQAAQSLVGAASAVWCFLCPHSEQGLGTGECSGLSDTLENPSDVKALFLWSPFGVISGSLWNFFDWSSH